MKFINSKKNKKPTEPNFRYILNDYLNIFDFGSLSYKMLVIKWARLIPFTLRKMCLQLIPRRKNLNFIILTGSKCGKQIIS